MDEDVDDVSDLLGEIRDHPFEDLRSNVRGLVARVQAMGESVNDLAALEESIQDRPGLIIPQSKEEREQREEAIIEFIKIVDDSYLSSSYALLETMSRLRDVYTEGSEEADQLIQEYRDRSRVVLGMRIYSHHGNTLPVRMNSTARGEYFGDGEGSRERFLLNVNDLRDKFGEGYNRDADYHYSRLDQPTIHVLEILEEHHDEAKRIADQLISVIEDENSELSEEYYDMGDNLLDLLDRGAHNRYD